jgi:nucleoside 2-deoxyribosyltransferase
MGKGLGKMKVYVASPLGFSETSKRFYIDVLLAGLAEREYTVLDPWTLTPQNRINAVAGLPYGLERQEAWRQLNPEIGDNNRRALDECDAVLAVLDGPDVDSGTASEIGYAAAKGKVVLGYRNDFRLSADNEGSIVNLQVEHFIRQSGGTIVKALTEVWPALDAIQAALQAPAAQTPQPIRFGIANFFGRKDVGQQRAAFVIISLMLTLIVRAALESAFRPSVQGGARELSDWEFWLQLFLFAAMMLRFYLGATRYVDTEPENIGMFIRFVNCIFAFLIFCTFYVVALSITRVEFYYSLVILHCIDIAWFAVVLTYTGYFPAPVVSGDILPEKQRDVMLKFLGLSTATIIVASILYEMRRQGDIVANTAEVLFMFGLVALSMLDFVLLWKYYFDHKTWIAENAIP